MAMFGDLPLKSRKRKGRKHMSAEAKIDHIITMMDRNAAELEALKGVSGWGFCMSQIADMIAYSRSTALLNFLLECVDNRLIAMEVRTRKSCGLSNVEYWFYTHHQHKLALKQGRLIDEK